MNRIDYTPENKGHERVITMSTFTRGDNHIVVVGRLYEVRMKDYYLFTGEKKPAGPLHDLTITMLVKVPELLIEDIESAMTAVPREDCHAMADCLDRLRGMSIEQGFTLKVRSLLSGVKGCTHLTHLLITMAPAVMQGFWAVTAQKAPHERGDLSVERIAGVLQGLKNSCYAWREDGPALKRLKSLLKP